MKLRLRARLLIVLVPLLWPAAAIAQTPPGTPSPTPTIRETVEVVATRLPEFPDEVPLAIEVVTADELRARNVTDLQGALALATGVDVAPGGDNGPASAVPEFWGLKEFDAFLLVVDDVPWGGAFNPALSTISLQDVERIEVLRGPAPVMYGATSFVGVIHIVHKSPAATTSAFTGRVGSFGSGGGSASFVVPMGSWQSRVTVDGDRQGFRDDRTSFSRGHVLWRTAESSSAGRIWFAVNATLLNQEPASPSPRIGTTLTPLVPLDANQNPDGAFLNDRRVMGLFGIERGSGARTWTTTVSVSHASQDAFRGFLDDIADPDLNARGIREQIDMTDLYADSHLAWNWRPNVRLIAGGDFLHGNADAHGADFDYFAPLSGSFAPVVTPPSVLDVGIDDRRDFFGGYVASEWTVTPQLRIDAGIRLNITNEEREGGEEQPSAGEADAGAQTHVRPGGSVGAIWSAWSEGADHVKLFANYRNTFKPAAIDFGIGEAEGEGGGPLKPETSQSFEAGVKVRTWEGRADLQATAFVMSMANLVIAQSINGLPALTNAGTERFAGFEMGAAGYFPRDIVARATYSFHDATFTNFSQEFDGVVVDLSGKRLEMSARHLASAGVMYTPALGIVGSAEMNFVGSRYLDRRNTALTDAYATFSAGVGYRTGRWEVRVDGRNLTDERPPVSESELGDAQYYRLPSRRVDLTFAVRFGG